jgi:DnaJ-class molecular chaperone
VNPNKFKELMNFYQVVGNEQKRKQYDQLGFSFSKCQAGGAYGGF